jgi:hypothetical protein
MVKYNPLVEYKPYNYGETKPAICELHPRQSLGMGQIPIERWANMAIVFELPTFVGEIYI